MVDVDLSHLETEKLDIGDDRYLVYQLAQPKNPSEPEMFSVVYITEAGVLAFEDSLEDVVSSDKPSVFDTDERLSHSEETCDLCGGSSESGGPYYFSVLPRDTYGPRYFEKPANPIFSDQNYYTFSEICVCGACGEYFQQKTEEWVTSHTQIFFSHII